MKIKDLNIIFPNERIFLQRLPKEEFEFSINDNIDFLEKIAKQENKELLQASKNINPDKLLDSITAMEGIDVDGFLEEEPVKKRARKRKM